LILVIKITEITIAKQQSINQKSGPASQWIGVYDSFRCLKLTTNSV